MGFEAKKPYDFERSAPSTKEQPNTTGEKTPKFQLIKYHMAFGTITSCYLVERDFRYLPTSWFPQTQTKGMSGVSLENT